MWDLNNHTPFDAFSGFERDKDGRHHWLVWVKATFVFRNKERALFTPNQIPLFREPIFLDQPGDSEALADTDLTPVKQATDIIVSARSAAPADIPEEGYVSSVQLGKWCKELRVFKPSELVSDGQVRDEENAIAFPLGYSASFGGISKAAGGLNSPFLDNPIGRGFGGKKNLLQPTRIACLSASDVIKIDPFREYQPVTFGILPRSYPLRARYSGTYDGKWKKERSPLLPADFDERFWHAVPADQIYDGHVVGGEEVHFASMAPMGKPVIGSETHFNLPDLQFELKTKFLGAWQDMELSIQTVHLLIDRGLFTITYAASLPIEAPAHDVEVELSDLSLSRADGFSVKAEDLELFESNRG